MKYKTTKFTIEEKQDILEQYGEWIKPENMVWVEKEYKEKVKQFSYHRTKGYKYIEDYLDKNYPFAKNYAEKVWVLERLKDFQKHTSVYIEDRIGEYPIKDFDDEFKQRIMLKNIESGSDDGEGFSSKFIEDRINDFYTIHSGVKYQVHNDTHRHSFSVLYDDLEEAIDQFFEIRRKMR